MPEPQIAQREDGKFLVRNDETGERMAVDASELRRGLPLGWRPETLGEATATAEKKEFTSLGQKVAAGAEGVARGATLGLSDVALTETGLVDPEQARLRQEYNQEIALGGEAAGSLLGLGKLGAVTKAGKFAAGAANLATAPSRMALRAGLGAERLAARGLGRLGVAEGSVLGRAGSMAAGGAVEGSLFGAGQVLSEEALSGGNYENLAERVLAGAQDGARAGALFGAGAGGLIGLGKKGLKAAARFAPEDPKKWLAGVAEDSAVQALDPSKAELRKLTQGGRAPDKIKKIGRKLLDDDIVAAGRSEEKMLERATDVMESKGKQIGEVIERLEKDAGFFDGTEAFQKIDDSLEKLRSPTATQAEKSVARRVEREVQGLRELSATGTLRHSEVHDFRRRLDKTINWSKVNDPGVHDELSRVRGVLEDELERSIETAGEEIGAPELVATYKSAKESYGAARFAEKQLLENQLRGQANLSLGLLENIQGAGGLVAGALTGSLGIGAATAAASAIGGKFIREHGRGILAQAADLASRTDREIGTSIRKYLAKGREGASRARGAATGIYAGSEVDAALDRRKSEPRIKAFERAVRQVQNATPPERMAADLEAPQTAQAIRNTATRAIEFLKSKVPGSDRPTNPLYESPEPHPEEIAKFSRYYNAVKNPTSVLKSLRDGTLTSEEVEAIRTVYPNLYNQIRDTAMDELMNAKQRPTYEQRIRLGGLLDLPTDPSLEPRSIQITQGAFEAGRQPQEPPADMPPAKPLADDYETMAQELESQEFAI